MYAGNAEDPPAMEVLPSPEVPEDQWTERMRFAWMLAEQSFELAPPEAPVGPTVPELQQWVDQDLERWLAQKNRMVQAARAELDLAAEESHQQRIMAGAVVGLMYEDVARVLRNVPVPTDLADEPEIAETFRDIQEYQASSFLEHARRAYRACALNARQPASMKRWSEFCGERRDRLPMARGQRESTTVTVSVDE